MARIVDDSDSSPASSPERWPAWATEPVHIVRADPRWGERGDAERRRLEEMLRPWLVAGVHHVGSTAVPGLAAKPILDLMAGVRSLDVAPEVAAVLRGHGWHFVPPALDQRAWRRFFVKVERERRAAHLHLMQPGAKRWDEQLAFRDCLRERPELVAEYARLKQELGARLATDREAYTRAK